MQGCVCVHGYSYGRVPGQDPTCTLIPPVKWHIWGPLLAVAAVALAIALRYVWLRAQLYLASMYMVNSKLEPPGIAQSSLSVYDIHLCIIVQASCMTLCIHNSHWRNDHDLVAHELSCLLGQHAQPCCAAERMQAYIHMSIQASGHLFMYAPIHGLLMSALCS